MSRENHSKPWSPTSQVPRPRRSPTISSRISWQRRGREILRQLLQDHLDLRAAREEAELTDRHAAGPVRGRNRLEHDHIRQLATVVGSVTVRRCALRAPGRRNFYPADAVLSLPSGRHSHGLRRLAVLEAVRSSYDTYWTYHLTLEHQRVHPNDHQLAA